MNIEDLTNETLDVINKNSYKKRKNGLIFKDKWIEPKYVPSVLSRASINILNYWYKKTSVMFEFYDCENKKVPSLLTRKGDAINPYNFEISYQIEKGGILAVRIPGYVQNSYAVYINNFPKDMPVNDGYVYIDANDGDRIKIKLEDKINVIYPIFTNNLAQFIS